MATETYPPAYVKPGETVRLSARNGEIEFIGVYDDRVLDFFVAFVKWQKLKADWPISRPDSAEILMAENEMREKWNRLPSSTLTKTMERMNPGGIWLPETGGTDNAR